ncbi:NAD(P)/FAD-dependent oxidoreductase [Candidatus Magnetaquicoccus inordinatus]|uniref:NAD(P)/FAD-dependent oxidoreductase n=1 Tax=Candidatus Magnetaquicoccus inordinatus TaxID=2496818 RepID=UPI00102B6428|nr:FAD-dependent oxidoreductase [Candidatus Magnetaquicoccus inordinatus]
MTAQVSSSVSSPHRYVIIGNGVAGNQAAERLRERDPEGQITIITNSRMLFYNRYLLPQLFHEHKDWRALLAYPAEYYERQRIRVLRDCWVTSVDSRKRQVMLAHNEAISYDTLLVATGGRPYLPEELVECRHLIHPFGTYEHALAVRKALPENGSVVMLGGDMIGLDLARTLLALHYRVILVTHENTFWPHQPVGEERNQFLAILQKMGIEVVDGEAQGGAIAIEKGASGLPERRVRFRQGGDIYGDVVMSFYGLLPLVEFMMGSGTDIERGLLVGTNLRTSDPHIYAAGDVCQIWSEKDNVYRFYYGHRNVRAMGAVAALNMTGGNEHFSTTQDEALFQNEQGYIDSPFWAYD